MATTHINKHSAKTSKTCTLRQRGWEREGQFFPRQIPNKYRPPLVFLFASSFQVAMQPCSEWPFINTQWPLANNIASDGLSKLHLTSSRQGTQLTNGISPQHVATYSSILATTINHTTTANHEHAIVLPARGRPKQQGFRQTFLPLANNIASHDLS